MPSLSGVFSVQQFTDLGGPLIAGRLYTYAFGTTTQKTAFTDSAGTIPQTYTYDGMGGQYIALNVRGELPSSLYLASGSYDLALKRADGSTVWTRRADGAASVSDLAGPGGAGLIGWALTAIASVTRWVGDKLAENVSVFDFMTLAEIADVQGRLRKLNVTAKIQLAINHAQLKGVQLFAPAGDYLVTSLTVTKGIRLYGEGFGTVFVVMSTVDAATDIMTISPDALNDAACYGYRFEKFKIIPQSGAPGRHGIAVDIRTSYVAYSSFEKLFIKGTGGRAFATLPAATPRIDGFFTSSIEKCVLSGGIYLDKAGDSLRITENTLTGPNVGIHADLVNGTDGGAHGLLITGNNITSNGGSLRVLNAWAGRFENNNCEMPTPSGVANAAMIDIDGYAGNLVTGFVVGKNYLGSAIAGYDTIRVNLAKGTVVEKNYVARPAGSKSYRVTANAQSTQLLHNIDALDETVAAVLDDQGLRTLFMREFGGDLQTTSHLGFTKANRVIKWADSAGNLKSGIGASAVDNTFNVGFQDVPANNGHLILWANGVPYARINPDGRFSVGSSGDSSAILSAVSTTKGFLPPAMTTAQKNAIDAPAAGLVVYDLTLNKLCVNVGNGVWQTLALA